MDIYLHVSVRGGGIKVSLEDRGGGKKKHHVTETKPGDRHVTTQALEQM